MENKGMGLKMFYTDPDDAKLLAQGTIVIVGRIYSATCPTSST